MIIREKNKNWDAHIKGEMEVTSGYALDLPRGKWGSERSVLKRRRARLPTCLGNLGK